jgi:transcriptional regulator with XRE-family HTH domain
MTVAPNEYISNYIGQRIRERRKLLKLSQGELAKAVGISPQQIQKYESGANQISVVRLLKSLTFL